MWQSKRVTIIKNKYLEIVLQTETSHIDESDHPKLLNLSWNKKIVKWSISVWICFQKYSTSEPSNKCVLSSFCWNNNTQVCPSPLIECKILMLIPLGILQLIQRSQKWCVMFPPIDLDLLKSYLTSWHYSMTAINFFKEKYKSNSLKVINRLR